MLDKEIKFKKPSLIKRFIYWLGIKKDPRYDGSKVKFYTIDAAGHTLTKLCCDCKKPLLEDFSNRCPECWDYIYFPR
jgi:hypothetical protein